MRHKPWSEPLPAERDQDRWRRPTAHAREHGGRSAVERPAALSAAALIAALVIVVIVAAVA